MALTGTPLINDIEDFRAIWQFLGWIDDKKPRAELMDALEETGLTPVDPGFYPAARSARHRPGHRAPPQGRRRRRHPGPPHRRPAGRARRRGRPLDPRGRARARPPAGRAATTPRSRPAPPASSVEGIDHELVRRVADLGARGHARPTKTGENVFSMMRRIGQAKAGLAADYAAQLARNVGKVVFFAKHIDVMDAAEETFAKRGIRYSSIRGDQTPDGARRSNIDAFVNDPDVAGRRLLADRGRRRAQPAGRLQRRARRAVVDRRRADPGHRPGPPHRPGRAGHGLADHRRADHRHQDRRADRQQGRPRRPGARRLRRGGRRPRPTSSSRRWSRCSPRRSRRPGSRGSPRSPRAPGGRLQPVCRSTSRSSSSRRGDHPRGRAASRRTPSGRRAGPSAAARVRRAGSAGRGGAARRRARPRSGPPPGRGCRSSG